MIDDEADDEDDDGIDDEKGRVKVVCMSRDEPVMAAVAAADIDDDACIDDEYDDEDEDDAVDGDVDDEDGDGVNPLTLPSPVAVNKASTLSAVKCSPISAVRRGYDSMTFPPL